MLVLVANNVERPLMLPQIVDLDRKVGERGEPVAVEGIKLDRMHLALGRVLVLGLAGTLVLSDVAELHASVSAKEQFMLAVHKPGQ